jgi:hypothetical protein
MNLQSKTSFEEAVEESNMNKEEHMIGSRKPRALAAVGVLLATLGAGNAFAQEPPAMTPPPPPPVGGSLGVFGERGQFVVRSDLDFTLQRTSYSMGGGSSVLFGITPSLDYFVSSNFSVGGFVTFSHQTNVPDLVIASSDKTVFGIGARVGYHIVLTNVVSLWPQGGLVYLHDGYDAGMAGDFSGYLVQFQVFAPVLWHPAPHFFIGAGPAIATDLVSSFEDNDRAKATSFGILSTIGGYWGGL